MKKGIFAHRKTISNLQSENKIEISNEKLRLSSNRPWRYRNSNRFASTHDDNDENLWFSKLETNDNDLSTDYFLKIDNERLMGTIDCNPNELAAFIDNELKMVEDKNALMQLELLAKFESLKENVCKVDSKFVWEIWTKTSKKKMSHLSTEISNSDRKQQNWTLNSTFIVRFHVRGHS